VNAASAGTWGNGLQVEAMKASDSGFKLEISRKNANGQYIKVEAFDNLLMSSIMDVVNKKSSFIRVIADTWNEGNNVVCGSGEIPVSDPKKLQDGDDGLSEGTVVYIGSEDLQNGLHAFDPVDDINIVAIPDALGDDPTMKEGYIYCENRKDCFFIVDSKQNLMPQEVLALKKEKFKSSFGAIYYPWIMISDPITGNTKTVPPSGTVAGIYSRTDVVRGVHKAPAGVADGYIKSALGLERVLTKGEHDVLNNPGINVIRFFPGSGICLWGARTLSDDPEWKYVNVRRLFLFLEESIDEATQWVVFEPNEPALWGMVKRDITAFLLRVWRSGALFGATQEEAFYVKIDEENNPEEERNNGRLIIEIGVAAVKPAEFVIIRISQKTTTKA
jgi:phage tail sheath protein FI